ncbi:concanavalin A-like lectin/glucanase domain-containing protein [Parachaetomium inaequale]|uniref:Concanavalin A-like lectin/glucanase domain-containing protein n=1 Tax=Parachaetomium inaequale TaxID=2588326 RepID=A0AAN6PFL6_9PEZI|nr:concanavalin A-like lectin/glucanase domain-containing protein [Parachaetomium inaequale]
MPTPRHRSPLGCSLPFIHSTITFVLLLLLCCCFCPPLALADCECGYLATVDGGSEHALFTDLLETNFARLANDDTNQNGNNDNNGISQDTDWAPQAFNLTRERARGVYGEMFAVENVRYHHHDAEDHAGEGGLELVVRSEVVDGMVSGAELDTERLDLWWGTFRAVVKVPGVGGSCAAFFWYFNDTQEIDMEFLTKDFNATNSSYPVNLVLQSREAALAGYDASQTGNFIQAYLPFDPTETFHEYRIDYLPGRVLFYADGELLARMAGPAVPSSPGHLILQHWSNGNERWSGGPPARDAALVVRSVKAYFNSSMGQRQRDWAGRCRDPAAPRTVCGIPDVTPGNWSAADWFFGDHGNMTNNQTVSEESGGARSRELWWSTVGGLLLVDTTRGNFTFDLGQM